MKFIIKAFYTSWMVLGVIFSVVAQCPAPSVIQKSGCPGSYTLTASSSSSSVTSHRWYTTSTGGSAISGTVQSSPTNGVWISNLTITLSSTQTFYVAAVCGGTESARTPLTFTLSPPAPMIIMLPNGVNPGNLCDGNSVVLTASGASNCTWHLNSPTGPMEGTGTTYTATQGGTYYLNATNGCNQAETKSMTLTYKPNLSEPGISTPGADFCQGSQATTLFTGSAWNASAYTWAVSGSGNTISGGTVTWNPFFSGTATVTLTAHGCNGTQTSKSKSLTVFSLPDVTTTPANSGIINFGAEYKTLSCPPSTGGSYQWYKNAHAIENANANTYNARETGNYKVAVTSSNQCAASSTTIALSIENNYNYIITNALTTDKKSDGTQITEADINGLSADKRIQQIAYFDGLGRPIQNVSTQASPLQKDVVQPITYDRFGRDSIQYLPYVASTSDGFYKVNATGGTASAYVGSQQHSFYNNSSDDVADDTKPYSIVQLEFSPFNRVLKKGEVGSAWQPDANPYATSTDHTKKIAYEFNTSDEVLNWTASATSTTYPFGIVNGSTGTTPNYYPPNTLTKTKAKDEDQHEVIEYNNARGQIVLRKVQSAPGQYAQTYYIYDDFSQLVCVLPPEAVDRIIKPTSDYFGKTDNIKETFLRKWAFRYRYDHRKRNVVKHIPGADSVLMVYDNRDRLVLSQDGNQRALATKEWTFTKYDVFNRPILTGRIVSSAVRVTAQKNVNDFYKVAGNEWFDSYVGSQAGNVLGYNSKSYPKITNVSQYNTVFYYDKYDAYVAPSGYTYINESLPGQDVAAFLRPMGSLTCSLVKNLNAGTWLRTVSYFNQKGQVIQLITDHQKGTIRTSNVVDFIGKVVLSKRTYVVNSTTVTVKETFTYDHMNRPLTVKHSFDGAPDVMTVKNVYNALGQLIDKNLHSTDNGSTFKQSVDYRYNIRGWLTKINEVNIKSIQSGDNTYDYFGMSLAYNDALSGVTNAPAFNGNISGLQWSKGVQTGVKQSYVYSYDAMSRLLTSSHYDYDLISQAWTTSSGAFTENLTYDLNGNISRLMRKTDAGALMDSLRYGYDGNKLSYVHDAGDPVLGFVNGNAGTDDYNYDNNGNLIRDKNKSIADGNIKYNFLNLPRRIYKTGADSVVYAYNAMGQKMAQQVYGTTTKTTDYIGELVYEGNVLKFVNHAEGRIIPDGGNGEYQYVLRDHLGNVHTTFTAKTQATTSYATNFEATSNADFLNYNNTSFDLVDHTDATGTTYTKTQLLNGGPTRRVGLAKTFTVMPGDEISASAYVKYMNLGTTSNPNAFINSLSSAFCVSSSSTGEQLKAYNGLNNYAGLVPLGDHIGDNESAPKVFVTILFFDKNYKLIDAAWDQVSTVGAQTSGSVKQPPHDLISVTAKAPVAGYAYVFLSNEHPNYVDAYFDDANFSYTPSPIVSVGDYYPFGLSYNASERTGQVEQKFLYNGKELQDELSLNWYDYGARMYMPEIGRWGCADPLAETSRRWTPYRYAFDNPLRFIDPDGRDEQENKKEPPKFEFVKGGYGEDIEVSMTYGGYIGSQGESSKDNSSEEDGSDFGKAMADAGMSVLTEGPLNCCGETDEPVNEMPGGEWNMVYAAVPIALGASAADGPLPIGEAIGGATLLTAAAHDLQQQSKDFKYVTYTKTAVNGTVYVGRTSGYGPVNEIVRLREIKHHMNDSPLGYGKAVASTWLPAKAAGGYRFRLLDPSYWAIRGSEQAQIEFWRAAGKSGNSINGIGPYNTNRQRYWEAAKQILNQEFGL